MATTVTVQNLTVTITEQYTLNGVAYGNTMNKTYTDNGQVSQRIMTVSSKGDGGDWTNILALSNADGQGQVVKTEYKYFRITNLDDTHTLHLRVYNGSDYVAVEVNPASSLLLMDPGIDSPTGTGAITFADIEAIAGQSSHASESLDVEFIMVTS